MILDVAKTQNSNRQSINGWECKYFILWVFISEPLLVSYMTVGKLRCVMRVMKMGDRVSRAGLKTSSLALWANVLPLHNACSLMSTLYARLPVYVAVCLRGQCILLQSSPWNYKYVNACNYIEAMVLQIHTQGRFINHTALVTCTGSWSQHQCHRSDNIGKYCV